MNYRTIIVFGFLIATQDQRQRRAQVWRYDNARGHQTKDDRSDNAFIISKDKHPKYQIKALTSMKEMLSRKHCGIVSEKVQKTLSVNRNEWFIT